MLCRVCRVGFGASGLQGLICGVGFVESDLQSGIWEYQISDFIYVCTYLSLDVVCFVA